MVVRRIIQEDESLGRNALVGGDILVGLTIIPQLITEGCWYTSATLSLSQSDRRVPELLRRRTRKPDEKVGGRSQGR